MASVSASRSAAVFLVDMERGSYALAADLYAAAFSHAGIGVELRPYPTEPPRDLEGRWVVHHTIGPLYRYVPGSVNTAVVFHEWSRYPAAWTTILNQFESVWAPSGHVEDTLNASGVGAPIRYVPPPLSFDSTPSRRIPAPAAPFRFLAVGEPHFRKGFHLLLDGYQRAFPQVGCAELTLKVSATCEWPSPRPDITLIRERLSPNALVHLYESHDALVSASLGEGLGLPVAEAVAARLPVVTNLWGGHRDIVDADGCWRILHDEVPQLFCSAPDYFADGQRCAYSSPDRIAAGLLSVVNASPGEREARAIHAWMTLRQRHGLAAAAARVAQHAFPRTSASLSSITAAVRR
jgi:glycosyltransferase involved in cell wall biosynthesis